MENMLDLEELYNIHTSEEQIKESYERRTVPTGRYTFTAERANARLLPEGHFLGSNRKVGSFSGALKDQDGARRGRIMFDASWEVQRKENGKMDGLSVLWGQYCTALGMKDASVGEVMEATKSSTVSLYVTESFKTPDGWRTARNNDERVEYRKAGYDAKNFVQSVSRA